MLAPSNNCLEIIKRAERLELEAYPDAAQGWLLPTIGYGHTKGVKRGDRTTAAQANIWLAEDVNEAAQGVLKACPNVSQNQLDALTSFAFNTGVPKFRSSSLARLVASGDPLAYQQFGRWVNGTDQKGKLVKLPGLVRRRAVESALFRGEPDYMKHFEDKV